ncbi:ABC transporter ATP-binding protein [Clostridium fungisolvens]|uniref:Quaternary amine transport ATP-binding protein n=1 Tax=Clostridium fungisolvens TaxID=1604897 RepID=A0A6V8SHC6_9CLOT|nr:ABC transporter ATP-binding protein [Clostridium fungisolvens]GFP76126.1 Vitamin B12 import ATP-binding protein BtuD [Clostridium fungisolvens]
MIKFENVSKCYDNVNKAVDSLNLTIEKGEFFVIIGPSGCGKTTTLKMINRLIDLSEGTIYLDDKKISEYNIHELRWNIGYVLQQIALFPHMTIEENIAIVPELKKWDKKKIKDRITDLLESVGLEPEKYRHRKPSELSGGEQQRVGVVRALAADPNIILMDEPFSALDPISRKKLQQDMVKLKKKINKTIVFVTHDMQEALELGDRICIMQEGKIVQCDTPEAIINNPKNDFVRNFFKSANVYRASLFESDYSVKDLVDEGFIGEIGDKEGVGYVNAEESLEKLFSILTKEENIKIKQNEKIIGTLNMEHLVKFVANKLEKDGEI